MTREEAAALIASVTVPVMQWPDELAPFLVWLSRRRVRHVLELGTGHGGTAAIWCAIATGTVVSVDLPHGAPNTGLSEELCRERNALLTVKYPKFCGIVGDSHDRTIYAAVQQALRGHTVDLLFIDGDHSYAGVCSDFLMYGPLASEDGVIAFHDITVSVRNQRNGVHVYRLWDALKTLPGERVEFTCRRDWGGIGAMAGLGV